MPASLDSLVLLIFSMLECAYGPSHSRFVPVLYFSWEPHSRFVVKVLVQGQCSTSHGISSSTALPSRL